MPACGARHSELPGMRAMAMAMTETGLRRALFRFFLPPPMKYALHRSAEHVGMRLSHHLRHLVLSALHGHLGAGDAGRRPGTR